ncbi:hypothetical protein VNO77_17426 [Canavalia gladiata]|uniref:Uncharacterized protein n=1 Tax=Canavalia gladiata TaxID=3824 RepID=A0AAN9QGL8_CANGL
MLIPRACCYSECTDLLLAEQPQNIIMEIDSSLDVDWDNVRGVQNSEGSVASPVDCFGSSEIAVTSLNHAVMGKVNFGQLYCPFWLLLPDLLSPITSTSSYTPHHTSASITTCMLLGSTCT